MALIRTPIPNFNGYRAGTLFKNGVGRQDDPRLIDWFKTHGYIVETDEVETKEQKTRELTRMTSEELKEECRKYGINTGSTKSKDKLMEKLKEVM